MTRDDEPHDPALSATEDAKRPTALPMTPSTLMVPEPGGFQLQQLKLTPAEAARPEQERAQADTASVPSIEDYAKRRAQDSSHRLAPLRGDARAASSDNAKAAVEEHVAFWGEVEAHWRPVMEPIDGRDNLGPVSQASRDVYSIAAAGLTLGLASRACLANPIPENRRMLADLSPPWLQEHTSDILSAPPAQLPAAVLAHLDACDSRAERQALPLLSLIRHATERYNADRHRETRNAPQPPDLANDNGAPALRQPPDAARPDATSREDTRAPADGDPNPRTIELADERAELGGEFDWRSRALEAARELQREAAAERVREPEPQPTDRDEAEAAREQTDARRERKARDLQRAAREVVTESVRTTGRERDDEGGREL